MISLKYEPWDRKKDVLLERPGNRLGYQVINGSLPVGKAPDPRTGSRDSLIGPALEGIIGLLAGSLEWLRWYGLSAEDVQHRIEAFKRSNIDRQSQQINKTLQRNIEEISDAQVGKERLDPKKVWENR